MGMVVSLYRRLVCLNDGAFMKQQCSVCHREFSCGVNSDTCWCSSFPAIMSLGLAQACRCPTCLATAITKYIDQAIIQQGCDKVVAKASQYQKQELVEGIDYTTENGNMVFSKWYHLKRGSCCGNACRNCPYDKN
jgi:uncharacterized protein DUF5522